MTNTLNKKKHSPRYTQDWTGMTSGGIQLSLDKLRTSIRIKHHHRAVLQQQKPKHTQDQKKG